MENKTHQILIALAKGFRLEKMFSHKISNVLSQLTAFEITHFQDEIQIVEHYFRSKNIATRPLQINKNQRKITVEDYSHIIVFWDGDDLTDLIFLSLQNKMKLKIIPTTITKVRNKDKEEPFDVYIGRGTPWGNPFAIGIGGVGDDRATVIEKYQNYFTNEILKDPEKRKNLLSLRGYKLGCHCKPLACHGDIIAAYLNSDESYLED